MPILLVPAAVWWLLGGAAIGAGTTYVVSDSVKNTVTLIALGVGVYYLNKKG